MASLGSCASLCWGRCLLLVTLASAVLLPQASADFPGAIDSVTSCNSNLVEPNEGGSCAWNTASGGCPQCEGKCIMAAKTSSILEASSKLLYQSGLCTALATSMNLLLAFSGDDYDITFDENGFAGLSSACPSNEDVRAGFALMSASSEDFGDDYDYDSSFESMSGVKAPQSTDEAIAFFANNCENSSSTPPVCQLQNSDVDHAARVDEITQKCLNVEAQTGGVADGQCLPTGTFAHLDADCLMAHAADVSDATEADITAITGAFLAVHRACSAFETQASCVGAALETEVSASNTAVSAVQTQEVALIEGSGAAARVLGTAVALAAFLAALA